MNVDYGTQISYNEWSYGEVLFATPSYSGCSRTTAWSGVSLCNQDIYYNGSTNPYENHHYIVLDENT